MAAHAQVTDPAELWRPYIADRSDLNRNALAEFYLDCLSRIVSRFARRYPRHLRRDELRSDGFLGLLRAIERYDPDRKVSFETFATKYVGGAIIDELRTRTGVRRRHYARTVSLQAVVKLDPDATRNAGEVLVDRRSAVGKVFDRDDAFARMTVGLNRTERTALLMYYRDDFTMREIAAVVGCTESNISLTLTSVRARLGANRGYEEMRELLTA